MAILHQASDGKLLLMHGPRLKITIAAAVCLLSHGWAAERDFRVGCMGIQSFSAWSDKQVFPYRASRQRWGVIRKGFKQVRLGTSLDRVKLVLPPPDWAVETQQGCMWKFTMKSSDAKEADKYKGVVVGFREGQVVMLGEEESPWETVQH
jgi:hypothetical protein